MQSASGENQDHNALSRSCGVVIVKPSENRDLFMQSVAGTDVVVYKNIFWLSCLYFCCPTLQRVVPKSGLCVYFMKAFQAWTLCIPVGMDVSPSKLIVKVPFLFNLTPMAVICLQHHFSPSSCPATSCALLSQHCNKS